MKRLLAPFLLLAVTSLLAGCADEPPPKTHHRPPAYTQPPPDTGAEPQGEVPPDSKPEHEKHEAESSSPAPKNNPPPAQVGNYEYGKPVPGKPGFVTSPYEPYQGYIDVRGFPPGTEVKDPYTGKVFLVPAQ